MDFPQRENQRKSPQQDGTPPSPSPAPTALASIKLPGHSSEAANAVLLRALSDIARSAAPHGAGGPTYSLERALVLHTLLQKEKLVPEQALQLLAEMPARDRAALQRSYEATGGDKRGLSCSLLQHDLLHKVRGFSAAQKDSLNILLADDPKKETQALAVKYLELAATADTRAKAQDDSAPLKISAVLDLPDGTRRLEVASRYSGKQLQRDRDWEKALAGVLALGEQLNGRELKELVCELGKAHPRTVVDYDRGDIVEVVPRDYYLDGLQLVESRLNKHARDYLQNRVAGAESEAQAARLYALRVNGRLAPAEIIDLAGKADSACFQETLALLQTKYLGDKPLGQWFGFHKSSPYGRLLERLSRTDCSPQERDRMLRAAEILEHGIKLRPSAAPQANIAALTGYLCGLSPEERMHTVQTVAALSTTDGRSLPGLAPQSVVGSLLHELSTKPLPQEEAFALMRAAALLSGAGIDLNHDLASPGGHGGHVSTVMLRDWLDQLPPQERAATIDAARLLMARAQPSLLGHANDAPIARMFDKLLSGGVTEKTLLTHLHSLELMDALGIDLRRQGSTSSGSRPVDRERVEELSLSMDAAQRKAVAEVCRELCCVEPVGGDAENRFDAALVRFAQAAFLTDERIEAQKAVIDERRKLYDQQTKALRVLADAAAAHGSSARKEFEQLNRTTTGFLDYVINRRLTSRNSTSVAQEAVKRHAAAYDISSKAEQSLKLWSEGQKKFEQAAQQFARSYAAARTAFIKGDDSQAPVDALNRSIRAMNALPLVPAKLAQELQDQHLLGILRSTESLSEIQAHVGKVERYLERARKAAVIGGAMITSGGLTGLASGLGWSTARSMGAGVLGGTTVGGVTIGTSSRAAEGIAQIISGRKTPGQAVADAGTGALEDIRDAAKSSLVIAPAIGVTTKIAPLSGLGGLSKVSWGRWSAANVAGGGTGGAVAYGMDKSESLLTYHRELAKMRETGPVTAEAELALRKALRLDAWSLATDLALDVSFGGTVGGVGGAMFRTGATNIPVNTSIFASLSALHRHAKDGKPISLSLEDVALSLQGAAALKTVQPKLEPLGPLMKRPPNEVEGGPKPQRSPADPSPSKPDDAPEVITSGKDPESIYYKAIDAFELKQVLTKDGLQQLGELRRQNKITDDEIAVINNELRRKNAEILMDWLKTRRAYGDPTDGTTRYGLSGEMTVQTPDGRPFRVEYYYETYFGIVRVTRITPAGSSKSAAPESPTTEGPGETLR